MPGNIMMRLQHQSDPEHSRASVALYSGGSMKKIAIATLRAAAITGGALAQTAPAAVHVGLLFNYTGALAEFLPNMENGARLAADQINAAAEQVFGGPLINLVVEDGATEASVGVDRARKLVEIGRAHV